MSGDLSPGFFFSCNLEHSVVVLMKFLKAIFLRVLIAKARMSFE